jgi:ribosomal protein S18 acetylase RimI-like enzyme
MVIVPPKPHHERSDWWGYEFHMPPTPVTIYYLEMHDPRDLHPRRSPRTDLALVRVLPPSPELNRFFYTAVGAQWSWTDRLPWTYQQWLNYLNRSELETWMLTVDGLPAGYFELEQQLLERDGIDVEIAYFGLLPQFVGQQIGAHLLTCAIERGWEMDASRVWVHTCTLDHPKALANYQARGMTLYKQETHVEEVAERPTGPWPGAFPE